MKFNDLSGSLIVADTRKRQCKLWNVCRQFNAKPATFQRQIPLPHLMPSLIVVEIIFSLHSALVRFDVFSRSSARHSAAHEKKLIKIFFNKYQTRNRIAIKYDEGVCACEEERQQKGADRDIYDELLWSEECREYTQKQLKCLSLFHKRTHQHLFIFEFNLPRVPRWSFSAFFPSPKKTTKANIENTFFVNFKSQCSFLASRYERKSINNKYFRCLADKRNFVFIPSSRCRKKTANPQPLYRFARCLTSQALSRSTNFSCLFFSRRWHSWNSNCPTLVSAKRLSSPTFEIFPYGNSIRQIKLFSRWKFKITIVNFTDSRRPCWPCALLLASLLFICLNLNSMHR